MTAADADAPKAPALQLADGGASRTRRSERLVARQDHAAAPRRDGHAAPRRDHSGAPRSGPSSRNDPNAGPRRPPSAASGPCFRSRPQRRCPRASMRDVGFMARRSTRRDGDRSGKVERPSWRPVPRPSRAAWRALARPALLLATATQS